MVSAVLDPDNRHLLVDALKPPAGMSLDIAVGTSFTLDLQALLLAPVSFAMFGTSAVSEGAGDPLALLEAVRRHAERMLVFIQCGCTSVPRRQQPILAWLEDVVVPVIPPPGHLFHPKVWALRFVNDDGAQAHRLLVSSRNLTFDASWDSIVRLDSSAGPSDAVPMNEPLCDFLRALPRRSVAPAEPSRLALLEDLAQSISSVTWELPEGAKSIRFWPLGIARAHQPDLRSDRSLVLSPFLSVDTVQRLAAGAGSHHLVSRAEAMNELGSDALQCYSETSILDSDTFPSEEPIIRDEMVNDEATDLVSMDDAPSVEVERAGTNLRGLHSKLYILERGPVTHVFTGSANATGPAFSGNVEFLVELTARTSEWGIDTLLGDKDGRKASMRNMLRPFVPRPGEPVEPSEIDRLTHRLDALIRSIAAVPFVVRVDTNDEDEHYRLHVSSQRSMPVFGEDVRVTLRPSTISAQARLEWSAESGCEVHHDAGTVTLIGITSFLVARATSSVNLIEVSSSTLINATLVGAPSDRKDRLLTAQLRNSDDLVRYLLFLLYDFTDDAQVEALLMGGGAGMSGWKTAGEFPLFEAMLRALAVGGPMLDRVAERIESIRSTGDADRLLPAGFDDIWGPIDSVRRGAR